MKSEERIKSQCTDSVPTPVSRRKRLKPPPTHKYNHGTKSRDEVTLRSLLSLPRLPHSRSTTYTATQTESKLDDYWNGSVSPMQSTHSIHSYPVRSVHPKSVRSYRHNDHHD